LTSKLTSLVCLYYPSQLIPGLAAVRRYRAASGQAQDDPVLVVVWCAPSVDEVIRERRRQTFESLLEVVPGSSLLFFSHEETSGVLSSRRRVDAKARYLRERHFLESVGEVFFSHDISVDFSAQAVMRACPGAERICFGDAWGLVYSNSYFESVTYPCNASLAIKAPAVWLRNLRARLGRSRSLGPKRRRLDARLAILILPSDPGCDFLRGKALLQVERETVEHVIEVLSSALLGRASEQVLGIDAVLLVGSFAESRLCEKSRELDLYAEVLAEQLPNPSKLLIKPHSAATPHKIEEIAERAAQGHHVEVLLSSLSEVPIELLVRLWPDAWVISFAYASVSLTYLKREKVLHAMCDSLIHKHFPPSSQAWMKSSNNLYLSEMEVARLT
jgi:hypothetical protein